MSNERFIDNIEFLAPLTNVQTRKFINVFK